MIKITLCQMTFDRVEEYSKIGIERSYDYVDEVVLLYDKLSDGMLQWIKEHPKIRAYQEPWRDLFSFMRNKYLAKVEPSNWICVLDPDERHSPELCQNLRAVIEEADKGGYNILEVPSEDHFTKEDGVTEITRTGWVKSNIFLRQPDTKYVGSTHETLMTRNPKAKKIPYAYEHHRTVFEMYQHGVRNHFCSDSNKESPHWVQFRRMCTNLGIRRWYDYRAALENGNIHSEIKTWMWRNKNHPNSEVREHLLYYYHLHPDERKQDEETYGKYAN